MANPFVFACITPHGLPILEELSTDNKSLMETTRKSMNQLGHWMREASPETIVVVTPHGLRIDGHFTVINTSNMYGELSEQTLAGMSGEIRADKGITLTMTRTVDRALAQDIVHFAQVAGLPTVSANFATSEGMFSTLPLDWGAQIPLSFMPNVPVVVISPTRACSFEDHIRFGQQLAQAVRTSGKRVGFIASCDWSHAHDPLGPYGYHEDARLLDAAVQTYLSTNDIEQMAAFEDAFIQNAKPDGIWQALILAGAIPKEDRNSVVLSYEVPTYFGLLCAAYFHNYEAFASR